MIVTLGLTIGFGKSDNLAAAYGIAVSLTMLMTSVLLFIAMREIWGWSLAAAGAVAGAVHDRRRRLLRRQHGQSAARRLRPAAARLRSLRRDVDLASRRDGGAQPSRRRTDADRKLRRRAAIGSHCSRARLGGVPHPRQGGHAARLVLARAQESFVARIRARPDAHRRLDAARRARGARHGDARGRQILARRGALRLHGAARHSRRRRRMQSQGRGDRSCRRDLLRRPRNHRAARGRQRSAAVAGSAVRRRWAATRRASAIT